MMISSRGRYALRVMLDMAEQRGGGNIRLKDIAAALRTNDRFYSIGRISVPCVFFQKKRNVFPFRGSPHFVFYQIKPQKQRKVFFARPVSRYGGDKI